MDTRLLEIDPDEIVLGEKLNSGSTGTIFRGTWRNNVVAVKQIEDKIANKKKRASNVKAFLNEISMANHLLSFDSRQYIVTVAGFTSNSLVMEFMSTDLLDFMIGLSKNLNPEKLKFRAKIAYDIACALAFLHLCQIIHCDLKKENVLLTADGRAKLCDLGLSMFTKDIGFRENISGTAEYIAPELLMGKNPLPYSSKVDTYSFFLLIFELFTLRNFTPDLEIAEIFSLARDESTRPEFPHDYPASLKTLTQRGWGIDPLKRPTDSEMVVGFKNFVDETYPDEKIPVASKNQTLEIKHSRVHQGKKIEKGGSCTVYQGTLDGEKNPVAIKKIKANKTNFAVFNYELEIIGALIPFQNADLYAVKYFGYTKHSKLIGSTRYSLVMEYMQMNLYKFIFKNAEYSISAGNQMAFDVASAIEFLHLHLKILHLDIKAENVMVTIKNGYPYAKLCDFGHSLKLDDMKNLGLRGTIGYISPEILLAAQKEEPLPYTSAVDIYALGILMYELFTQKYAYPDETDHQAWNRTLNKSQRPVIPFTCPQHARKLIPRCWLQNPEKRPTASEVVNELSPYAQAKRI